MPVYDEEKEDLKRPEQGSGISDDDLRSITGIGEDEEADIEAAAEAGSLEDGFNSPSANRQDDVRARLAESEDAATDEGATDNERGLGQRLLDMRAEEDKKLGLYKPSKNPVKKAKAKWKQAAALSGAFGGILGFLVGGASLFGLLANFKLEAIVQNLDRTTMARYNSAFERRSDAWTKAYLQLRVTENFGDGLNNGEHPLFVGRVDNDHPIRDWYRNLRLSSFEADMARTSGIVFRNEIGPDGKPRAVKITIKDKTILDSEEFRSGNITESLSRAGNKIDIEVLGKSGTSKEIRQEFKKAFKSATFSDNAIKNYLIRRDLANANGIRRWRMFEETREKWDAKKDNFKATVIKTIMGENRKSTQFVLCVLAMGPCPKRDDIADPANRAQGTLSGSTIGEGDSDDPNAREIEDTTNYDEGTLDEAASKEVSKEVIRNEEGEIVSERVLKGKGDGAVVKGALDDAISKTVTGEVNEAFSATFLKQLISKISFITSVKSMLDWILAISENFKTKALSKAVLAGRKAADKNVQVMFLMAASQSASGQFSSEQRADFMQNLGNLENSEGGQLILGPSPSVAVFSGRSYADSAAEKEAYCKLDRDERAALVDSFVWNCDQDKIGGKNRAEDIEKFYKDGPGKILDPIAAAYKPIKDSVVGKFFGVMESAANAVAKPVIDKVLAVSGGDKAIQGAMGAASKELLEFAGAIPPYQPGEPGGFALNSAVRGGAATNEDSTRMSGGAKSTAQSQAYYRKLVADLEQERKSQLTWKDRYFSIKEPNSLAYAVAFSLGGANTKDRFDPLKNVATNFMSLPGKTSTNIANAVSGRSYADTLADPYAAAEFAGVEAYDIPQECVEAPIIDSNGSLNPSFTDPTKATNAGKLGIPDKTTWETAGSLNQTYIDVFEEVDKLKIPEDTVKNYYNCARFDSDVLKAMQGIYNKQAQEDAEDEFTGDGAVDIDLTDASGSSTFSP